MTEKDFGEHVKVTYRDDVFSVVTADHSVSFTTDEARELVRFIQATVLEEAAASWRKRPREVWP